MKPNADRLNLAILQMPIGEKSSWNIDHLKRQVETLFRHHHKEPHLVVGVEFGISPVEVHPIPGEVLEDLADVARTYGVYLLPGTLKERAQKDKFYNTAGELIGCYRKMVPWHSSLEQNELAGNELVLVDIPEFDTKLGVLICLDGDFPEIVRAYALSGAEVLVQLSFDPDTITEAYRNIRQTRALENQAYYVYTCGTGPCCGYTLPGRSAVYGPHGEKLYEAGAGEAYPVIGLDLSAAKRARQKGSWGDLRLLSMAGRLPTMREQKGVVGH